ncbi:MAG: RNA-directed DNA polymerase [Muribaculum sp.]|nr:RNA-directed DNA polymerase [Muribaculum sp.]
MKSFAEYIKGIDFLKLYDEKILPKKGGGRDHISPSKYRDNFIKEKDWILEKCKAGEYRFSPYAEKLVLKGRGKNPRVLSIPNVRDRFVLALLNGYLGECMGIKRETPNRYIYRLAQYLSDKRNDGETVFFLKADISAFYDNINHSLLSRCLSKKIDAVALKLVMAAITTPTLCDGQRQDHESNLLGVPQGLSISNILAEIYFDGVHRQLKSHFSLGLFLRYVDDILIADTVQQDFEEIVSCSIKSHNLGLSLSAAKTKKGIVGVDVLEFIGYRIFGDIISIRESNRNRFSNRLVRRCHQIRNQFNDSSLRPRYIKDDDEFVSFARIDLNLLISGFKVKRHNYGWIAYFQQMNDLCILYQFDRLVKKSLGKELYDTLGINSIVRSYHDLRDNMGRSILIDFDSVSERGEKIGYLKKFGYIKDSEYKDISNEEVDKRFNILVQSFIRSSEFDIHEIS